LFEELGNESAMKIADVPKPAPKIGEVLVRVLAAGLNPVDVLITSGYYFRKPPLPYQPGFEGAGIVEEVGSSISLFKPGDRVTFRQGSVGFGRVAGSFAEYVVCLESDLMPTPDAFSDDEAGGFWLAGLTAWGGLIHLLNLQRGQTVIITAASGGVGHIAVRLAKSLGARVVATTRTKEKVAFIESLGADHIVCTDEADLAETVKSLGGADHAFDAVGGETTVALMKALKPLGRVVVYGAVSRKPPVVDFASLIAKATGILGFTMMTLRESPSLLEKAEADLLSYVTKNELKPHIGARFEISDAPQAWRAIKDGSGVGKIVITP
jgi:NADPH2:quinone reductase